MMKIFVTGGTGWVGTALLPELIAAGHEVTGIARSDESVDVLTTLGAMPVRGSLADLDVIAAQAAAADGVVHLAFRHDFANFAEAAELDATVVGVLGDALLGTEKPLVVTSGTPAVPGVVATEKDKAGPETWGAAREAVSDLALSYADRGVRVSIVRLPRSVHGEGDHGFVAVLARMAREQGRAGYVGDGAARWPAVHVRDAARLYRLALENAPAGSVLHAIGDEGIPFRRIADALGGVVGVSSESVDPDALGFLGLMAGIDQPASAARTRSMLGWAPTRPGLIEDIEAGCYAD